MTVLACLQEHDGTALAYNGKVKFFASFGGTDTKAVLIPGKDEANVEWNAGDKVSVLVGNGKYLYTADSDGISTNLTTESADVPANGTYYALYPYDESASLAGGNITTTLPSAQKAVLNSFTTHLAVATSTSHSLSFKNVCGLVKVTVNAADVTKIVFKGNSGETVSGTVDIAVSATPSWKSVAGNAETSVTLLPASGSSAIAEGDYYFAVLPQTFRKGFKVTAYKGDAEWVIRNVDTEVTIARADIVAGKPFVESAIYPVSGGVKTKTLQTSGDFSVTNVSEGMTLYHMAKYDDVSGAKQNVNVLEIDLDNPDYSIVFNCSTPADSTSAVAEREGAVAAINGTYEMDAVYVRTDGTNHAEVTLASDHLRYWKHNGAIVGDGGRKVAIVNGAGEYSPATPQAGDAAIELYKKLSERNLLAGAPMLIDDYEPVGASFVPINLTDFSPYEYEDYRRHQGVRHPRTAVAVTEDNDLLLIVVDGRSSSASGMSARELTNFIARHFNPRWALNLDGGGSSTMYLRGYGNAYNNVINNVAEKDDDGTTVQRKVRTHILVKHKRIQGTESNPYLIKTAEDMLLIRRRAILGETTYFRLMNNIDMSSVKKWTPVNYDRNYERKIHFDGNGKTITNFAPTAFVADDQTTPAEYPSLFGVLYGSCKNLTIKNSKIIASETTPSCGFLGGYVGTTGKPAVVENVSVQGEVYGGSCIGALAGQSNGTTTYKNCTIDAVLTSAGTDLGGIVGKIRGDSEMTGCRVKATFVSTAINKNRVGGMIGWNSTATTTITDCHVLEGTTLTDQSGRTASDNGNYGGFIGYGDTSNTVLKISGCSAHTIIDAGISTYNAGFIGGTGYESTVEVTDSWAAGSVIGANYSAGFIGAIQSHVTISRCWADVDVTSSGQRCGAFAGCNTKFPATISNCYATGNITATGQQVGGIIGYTSFPITITNCYATGNVSSATAGTGGIAGTITAESTVSDCIAWNATIDCQRTANDKWAPGAVVGAASVAGNYSGCYRRADMNFIDAAGAMVLVDQEDVANGFPASPSYSEETTQAAYHGKAAAADATVSSVAKALGWDESVWNLSGDLPKLK